MLRVFTMVDVVFPQTAPNVVERKLGYDIAAVINARVDDIYIVEGCTRVRDYKILTRCLRISSLLRIKPDVVLMVRV